MSDSRLEASVVRALEKRLPQYGFTYDAKTHRLVRPSVDCLQVVACNITKSSASLGIQPVLGARYERLEHIFEAAGAVARQFTGVALTVAVDAYVLQGVRDFVRLPLTASIAEIVALCSSAIEPVAEQYFSERSTHKQLDALVNNDPSIELLDIASPSRRCWTGISMAWINGRTDFEKLVSHYRSALIGIAKGFYMADFDKVEQYLRAHSELRESA